MYLPSGEYVARKGSACRERAMMRECRVMATGEFWPLFSGWVGCDFVPNGSYVHMFKALGEESSRRRDKS